MCKSVLKLEFDDVFKRTEGSRAPRAKDISRVLEWAKDKSGITVHCHAGYSRSAAVAYLIECAASKPEEAIKVLNYKIHCPNELIVKLGADILGNDSILSTYWEWREEFDSLWISEL